ncbi:uncharacterized protein LOC113521001 [Galleria mellonella]|uniref:Uncharacterized protein LOC113521001 n=1 Tax=Galleria mellonella TaxID=7137 RepID=A0ABM3MYU7_GALME|nr:uncharacterized protein LOC113521001 [Galleria mellonella]
MKAFIVLLALVSLGCSAPQQRKVFHEHVEDFLILIGDRVGQELTELAYQYSEFDEFQASLDYLASTDFKNLVFEMEALPEFKAVIDFLEQDNIDILYFIDRFNALLEGVPVVSKASKGVRVEPSGRDFTSFVRDNIDLFPKDELSALFDQKIAEDDDFRVAFENLNSDEWRSIFGALWESEVFLAEVQTLADNGIDFGILIYEIVAIFGLN